jgi:NAD(P)-dependent dehydrogenase (short-subunit alcohol dehydrogenase family)
MTASPPRSSRRPVVAVTGATAGIGRASALAFAARGDDVALIARGEAGLEATREEVEATGVHCLAIAVDVADSTAVEEAVDRIERELGDIDVWVNDAFASVFAPFTEITPEEFRRVTEVTYLGYVYATGAVLRRMLAHDHGTIGQVGSTLAYRGIPLQSAYCGAKHAIQGFHESLRCELLHDGANVHTTMVQLPAVNTPQFDWVLNRLPEHPQPVPPIFQPEVIARQIVYAAEHPQRREYVVGGSAVATIFGNRVAAGVLDRYLARTGYRSQQTGEPTRPDRPANLWEPADGEDGRDFGAHGSFDGVASGFSAQGLLTRSGLSPTLVNLGAAVVSGARMVAKDPKAFLDAVLARPA